MLTRHRKYIRHIFAEPEIRKRLLDMFARDRLFCLLLADLVGLRGN